MVWVALVVVGTWRVVRPPEPIEVLRVFGLQPGRGFDGGGGQRFRRAPSWTRPPASEVPADLWRIQIEVDPRDEAKLRRYHWNGWRGGGNDDRPEVLVTVREGGVTYTNVALHLKGSAGSFRPYDDKPALTLHFSKHASGQRFHGYTKISLNNSVQDPSFITEALCRELFDAAGVPAPKADHATVIINGRDLNLYVLTEGWGKPFLRRYFDDVSGNLYDSGFVQDIDGQLSVNSGDDKEDTSSLDRLVAAASERDPDRRWAALEKTLDLDRFASFLALEIMTCHWDGYALNRNNYRVFHDRSTDRMVFMPHGLDQMFGWGRSSPTASLYPSMEGLVARSFANHPKGRRLLQDRISTLRTNLFLDAPLTNRVYELAKRIRPTLAAYDERLAREHDFHVENLCQRIVERNQSIADQLIEPREPLSFDAEGRARLSGWRRRITSQGGGGVAFDRRDEEGTKVIVIKAGRGGSVASWRSRVLLEAGEYRFVGRARTSGIGNGGGAGLRISGAQREFAQGDQPDWTECSFDFEVVDAVAEVDLVCELAASRGEVLFDEGSLEVRRR